MNEAAESFALRRAHEGAVAKFDGRYFNRGHPVTMALASALDELIKNGLLALGQPDARGRQRVCVTHTGQAKYRALHNGQEHPGTGALTDEHRQPGLVQAKRLLDDLKAAGFHFLATAAGEDGPLLGQRLSAQWADLIYIDGFSDNCHAWRNRTSPFIVPGWETAERHVSGGALAVLGDVTTWETAS